MVESVDDFLSSSYVRGIRMPDFWGTRRDDCFSTEQQSSIILSSKEGSVWRELKAQKEDRFLRGRQIAYLICENILVTGANDSVEIYADLFTIVLRNDDIQGFDSKWDETL